MVAAWKSDGNLRDCLVMLHGPTGSGKTHTLCPTPRSKVAAEQKRGLLWRIIEAICPNEDTKMVQQSADVSMV